MSVALMITNKLFQEFYQFLSYSLVHMMII